jgi:hypothetical protein
MQIVSNPLALDAHFFLFWVARPTRTGLFHSLGPKDSHRSHNTTLEGSQTYLIDVGTRVGV